MPVSLASFGVPQLADNKQRAVVLRKRMSVYYSGRVQGVGFRYTLKNVAISLFTDSVVMECIGTQYDTIPPGWR